MPNILAEIVANKRLEIEERKKLRSVSDLTMNLDLADEGFKRSLSGDGLKLIAEIKPASPSAGVLQAAPDTKKIVEVYDQYADSISVLTDKKYFSGSLDLLSEVKTISQRPLLCKDFILDEYQVIEARKFGADAVLLIVKILDPATLRTLTKAARALGMTALIEIQDEDELFTALTVRPDIILINNRNLDTMKIDLSTTVRLAPLIPKDIICVSASGLTSRADLDSLMQYCNRFLIGSVLMKSADMTGKLKELKGL
ncbi:MAG: indole-3-glycerol phosphate synthase TrpC [Candidatus Obscuribacterales bacterium]|nr:indole-3-glycerol phosphate synthase TrpC [Candidatus Obscuribacterales bacterium]